MIKAFKIKDLLHASWHERDMYRDNELLPRPRAPVGFTFENLAQGSSRSTGRYGRHQNLIGLHKCILVLECGMKEKNTIS